MDTNERDMVVQMMGGHNIERYLSEWKMPDYEAIIYYGYLFNRQLVPMAVRNGEADLADWLLNRLDVMFSDPICATKEVA